MTRLVFSCTIELFSKDFTVEKTEHSFYYIGCQKLVRMVGLARNSVALGVVKGVLNRFLQWEVCEKYLVKENYLVWVFMDLEKTYNMIDRVMRCSRIDDANRIRVR